MQYSYTRLKTYQNCPKQFDFRYLQGLPVKTNTGMRFGEKLHKLISDSLTGTPDYSILDISQHHEAQALVANALAYIGDRTLVGSEIPLGVDQKFRQKPFDKAYLRGVVDAIVYDPASGIELIDFKTNYSPESKEQLLLYALLSAPQIGVLPEKLTFFSLRFNEATSWDMDIDEVENFRLFLKSRIARIETTKTFEPQPSAECDTCAFVSLCPAAQALNIPDVTDADAALKAFKEAQAHAAAAKKLKKAAKEYVKETGESLEDGGKVFGPVRSEAVSIEDREGLVCALIDEGYDTFEVTNIDTTQLKKIPDYQERFAKWLKITPRTNYTWSKKLTNGKEEDTHVECHSHSTRKTA